MRPETVITYELKILTGVGEVVERFTKTYDTDVYDEDKESTDWMFINFKMEDLKEKHGDGIVLLEVSMDRGALN
ncbi:hypothetical protein [Bacillus gaemokensis]|uniref:Uncharacterized protein n=1 Tax=Bacillus gaemokensis TaxID=574375 RepID=A0A073KC15_9BACI|nr:hypothetical protein [Bacillus gaemokensis]KEK23972.1 hypothetical protein BAGA_06060 [Bacillus gaemokensis]KYG38093.1 hypothetical protein AZF08_20290 [Bacillus gaemokensis]